MRYSWRQGTNKGTPSATLSRFVLITVLLAAAGLALVASVSSSAVGSGSVVERTEAKGETDRVHSRISDRAAAARRTHEALAFAAPFIGTITVDRTDDTAALAASLCTAAPSDCSLRGAIDFANSSPATTINVPAGNYNLTIAGAGEFFAGNNSIGDLDITGNNTSIVGAGAAVTIITQTTGGSRVIEVNPFLVPGLITSISGVTVSGGTETAGIGGGGILSGSGNGSLTISNSVISGNSATGVGSFGGGGLCHTGGSLTINGSTFSTNSTNTSGGGVSYSASDGSNGATGILTVSGSTFTSNTANSSAAGGGALDLYDFNASSGVYTINSSSFSSNTAPNGSGGAIIVESGGPLTVTTSSFATNSAGNSGGAIFSSGTVVTVMYSRLVGNSAPSGRALFRSSGIFTANDDWWGINSGPSPGDFSSPSGNVIPITWLQLRASGNPNAICDGGTSNITADIKQRNAGAPLTVELNGLPPFPAMFVNATPAVGSLSAVSANFVNGEASATFTASAQGTALIDVVGDNQTVTATVTVGGNTTTDPADQMVCEGGTATFTTTASGPGPFTFAWKKGATVLNNGDLGGRVTITSLGNSSTLSISNAQASDADTYTVEATGPCSTASQTATLTINQATSTTDPADATVCQGATASFSTTASGTGPFSYAWTLDGAPFNGDSPSINVPTGSLSIGNHTVVVTTTGACSASQSATLTVQGGATTTDPADATVCQGATAGFSTTASGTGPFSYAWTLDGSPFNGNSPSINVPTGSLSIGNHTVVVTTTGACGSASQTASLTVQANTSTTDPADQTVCQGATAGFSTTASGTGPFSYAWTLDGSPFNGDSASINVPTGSLSVGNHTVVVTTTGACGSASQTATLTVQANAATSDPPDQTVCKGATASFSTTASGTGPFHYAWTLDGSPFNGDSASINVPTGSLTVGNHTVVVTTTGACGSASQTATLTVQANTATTDPPDQTVCKGATASFSTTASGTGPFHYAWTLDGSPFNGDSASINVLTGSLSVGNHTVVVTTTGVCGSASQTATLTVQANTATTDPPDQTVCKGAIANFSTTASGTGPFHYAWTLDGLPFNGDSPSINVPTGSLSSGNHTVTVTTSGTCGSASQSATLTVSGPPVITLHTNDITLWPPNHKYRTFNVSDFVASASGCEGDLTNSVVIASVSSDELEDNPGGGDGNTLNDIVIAANCKSVQLRAERDGNLNGRVYTITFRVTDSQGNTTTATATVSVPHNANSTAVNGPGPGHTVTSACP